jgi:cytochrome b involved in lipid metabolism
MSLVIWGKLFFRGAGGQAIIGMQLGKDATPAFHGGVYDQLLNSISQQFFTNYQHLDVTFFRSFQCGTQLAGYV